MHCEPPPSPPPPPSPFGPLLPPSPSALPSGSAVAQPATEAMGSRQETRSCAKERPVRLHRTSRSLSDLLRSPFSDGPTSDDSFDARRQSAGITRFLLRGRQRF